MAFADNPGGRVIWEGVGRAKLVLAEAVGFGDLLGGTSAWVKATAGEPFVEAQFIAGERGNIGEEITVYRKARIAKLTVDEVGSLIYLSDIPGGYSDSPGTNTQKVGLKLGGGSIWVEVLGFIRDDLDTVVISKATTGSHKVVNSYIESDGCLVIVMEE